MLEVYERLGVQVSPAASAHVVLSHEQRTRGRLRTAASDGREVGIFLDRGQPLQVGELLRTRCGEILCVQGANEALTVAACEDWLQFSRACYHLGNRHVKVEVGDRYLKIIQDHVLEDMLSGLGLQLRHETGVFLPESGAYAGGHHHH